MSGIDIASIKAKLNEEILTVGSPEELEALRLRYLGRKGMLAELTGIIPTLAQAERASFGQEVNAFKAYVSSLVSEKQRSLSAESEEETGTDISLPGVVREIGHLHPLTQVTQEICTIFGRMGFAVIDGPEIETEYNNFTGLNIPLEHPSREAFDTFYLDTAAGKEGRYLLRSQTSTMQIRAMKAQKPPLAIVAPGRVYRPDAVDASHSFMFNQIEGFAVGENITFADLKGVLGFFARSVFGKDTKMRFRPHFFPYTEPSAEVDISCIICGGKGCSVCGRKGWLEILGAGMIHPNVFKNVGYPCGKYTGFAFGMGADRIAMLKYGIDDIRMFFTNDARFLEQF